MPPRFSSHCLHALSTLAKLAQPLCTQLGIQVNCVQWECAGNFIGGADFLWAAAVLHVLSKADCEKFVTSAHLLLKPGGTFYGWTVGNREAEDWHTTPDGKANRYLHLAVMTLSILSLSHFTVCVPACLPACLLCICVNVCLSVYLHMFMLGMRVRQCVVRNAKLSQCETVRNFRTACVDVPSGRNVRN